MHMNDVYKVTIFQYEMTKKIKLDQDQSFDLALFTKDPWCYQFVNKFLHVLSKSNITKFLQ